MGNNNSFLSNERNVGDNVVWPKDARKALDDIASKNIARYAPYSRKSSSDSPGEPKHHRESWIDDQYSKFTDNVEPTSETLFIDNIIQPNAEEINSKIDQMPTTLDLIKKSQDVVTSQTNPKILSIEQTEPRLGSSPNRSCDVPSRNVAAMILGGCETQNHPKKYPAMFQYHGDAKNVYVTGAFDNWRRLKMSKSTNSDEFIVILDLNEGT